MITSQYTAKVKERVVRKFILENKRAPSTLELDYLMRLASEEFATIDQTGFIALDGYQPEFRSISSAEQINLSNQALVDDLAVLEDKTDTLIADLEETFRLFDTSTGRILKKLNKLEMRLNGLLLSNSNADEFIYAISETFDTNELVIADETTASIEAGQVVMGKTTFGVYPLDKIKLSATVSSVNTVLQTSYTNDISTLKSNDGLTYGASVYTKNKKGRTTFILEAELETSAYVSELVITGNGIGLNKPQTYTVLISKDGATYQPTSTVESLFAKQSERVLIGTEIKKIQILFSKEIADTQTSTQNQWVYLFSLDKLEFYTSEYAADLESVIVTGPYEFFTTDGEPLYFTKSVIDGCVIEPPDTSVNFYLSIDGENWKSVGHKSEGNSVVSFAENAGEVSSSFFAAVDDPNSVQVPLSLSRYSTAAAINTYIVSDYADYLNLKSAVVRRNCPGETDFNVFGVSAGWSYSQGKYRTTVYVENPEGMLINFGTTSAYLNGQLVSGLVKFNQGYSVFETGESNYQSLSKRLYSSLSELRLEDALYPFNHKYLIEGIRYSYDFADEKTYLGVDEYFGELLQYVPSEYFHSAPADNYSIYTVEPFDDGLAFLVKVNKQDATWVSELIKPTWTVQNGETNQLYVKAVLKSIDSKHSPLIEQSTWRVI